MRRDFTEIDKAALFALYEACGGSVHAHVPEQAVTVHFRKDLRGAARHALETLRRRGYAVKHPTRGATTYQITPAGVNKLRELGMT